jgi:hypothetical protein
VPVGYKAFMKRWLDRAQVGIPLLWAGLVLGLSFIETPLRFRAPGVTREVGLSIGRLMFGTLNRIELMLALALFAVWLPGAERIAARVALTAVIGIVALQTGWLLPHLDAQAAALIGGAIPIATFHHALFIVLDVVKLGALGALALWHPTFAIRPVRGEPARPISTFPRQLTRGQPSRTPLDDSR